MRSKMLVCYVMLIFFLLLTLFPQYKAQAFDLTVEDPNGKPVSGYRWIVEEDTTFLVTPGEKVSDSLAVNIFPSYAPLVKNGRSGTATTTVDVNPKKRYAVSVLPDSGYANGGAAVPAGKKRTRQ